VLAFSGPLWEALDAATVNVVRVAAGVEAGWRASGAPQGPAGP
jgi:hypothetical protein